MVVDTAADYSIMTRSFCQEKFVDIPLAASKVVLSTYTCERHNLSGEMQCDVVYKNIRSSLPVVVVVANYRGKPTLATRQIWLSQIKLAWVRFLLSPVKTSPVPRANYKLFYQNMIRLATVMQAWQGFQEANIAITGVCKAGFCKSPSTSLCIEGTRLSRKIVTQTLASATVEVPKSDNTVRICGD